MKSNAQLAHDWVHENVVLSEHCGIEYSDLCKSLESLLSSVAMENSIDSVVGDNSTLELPPVRSDLHEIERVAQPSETVLIRIEGQAGLLMGRYIHGGKFWQADDIHGEVNVLEWWPLPPSHSGHSTKATS